MSAEVFAEWLSAQGFPVFRTASSYWCGISSRVYQAFPYSWVIDPPEEEVKGVLRKKGAIALRYSTPLAKPFGRISYHAIYDKPSCSTETLPRKVRYRVLQGLRYASCEAIPMKSLALDGWELRHQTLVRQGRADAEEKEVWERMCLCADGLPGFEAWGAVHDGELVSSLLSYTSDDCVSILYQQSKTEHLKYGVNNALTYEFTRNALLRPGVRCIFYGLHSLDAPPSLDEYKFRMGYTARPVRQRVVFNPLIQPLVGHASFGLLKRLLIVGGSNSIARKIEGVFQFYLQGRRPLLDQDWPEALSAQKEAILSGGTSSAK